jgi:hypothetical protein
MISPCTTTVVAFHRWRRKPLIHLPSAGPAGLTSQHELSGCFGPSSSAISTLVWPYDKAETQLIFRRLKELVGRFGPQSIGARLVQRQATISPWCRPGIRRCLGVCQTPPGTPTTTNNSASRKSQSPGNQTRRSIGRRHQMGRLQKRTSRPAFLPAERGREPSASCLGTSVGNQPGRSPYGLGLTEPSVSVTPLRAARWTAATPGAAWQARRA